MTQTKLWTKDFINISLSTFFVFLTFYYLLVTLPVYALQEFNAKESEAGLLITVFLFAAILIRPIAGKWIEQKGKRTILLWSLLIFSASSILYFLPASNPTLLILRFLHGIGFGMATTVCGAIVADILPNSRRGEGMGYYVMSTNLAMVIGPFLGLTAMQQWGYNIMFSISLIFSLCALGIAFFIKPPTKQHVHGNNQSKTDFKLKDMFELSAVPISIVAAIFAIVYSSILSFVSVYSTELGLVEFASFFFVVYALVLLLSRPFTGKWFDRYGENFIIYPCIILFAIGMFLLSQTQSAFMFLFSAGLIGLGWGTLFPSFQTIAIQEAVPKRRGLATATFLSIFDLGIAFGSFFIGMIAVNIDFSSLYFYGSFFILIGLTFYYFLHGKSRISTKEKITTRASM